MADYGSRYSDRKIRKVDRELKGIYRQAEQELKKKLADFVAASKARDRYKQQQRDSGVITEKEYEDWLKGQVFQKERWERKIRQVQQVMYNHNVEAAKIVHENKLDVFAENYDFEAFKAEWITGISFDAYSAETVSLLLKDRPQLLPKWKIDQEKDYKWNYRKVNNAVTQGIIQGESVDKVAERLVDNLCTQNENKMRMFARTAINEAQNAGRQAQMQDAAKKGIEVHKQWLATLDLKTRDTHRHLDGQEVLYDKPFNSDLGKIMFPGDPEADPANVFNCRCTVVTIYPEYEDRQNDWREDETIDGMTYKQWKNKKTEDAEKKKGTQSFTDDEKQSKINDGITKNNTQRIKQSEIHLQSDAEKLQSMRNYSSLDEETIEKAAEALFGFRSNPEYCYFDGADSDIRKRATQQTSEWADAIQRYIDASPKAEDTIYRGMGLPKEMLDSLVVGEEFDERKYAVSSWSTDETVGQRYASNSVNKYGGERVVFEYANPKHGTPVAHLSLMYTEKEVLVNNKDVKYRIVSKEEYVKSSKSLGDRKFTKIVLEEIGE